MPCCVGSCLTLCS
uniref:Uncharacterized protein n=1 Tax=Arundo donax TaxID=35708 RepID=A0A0A9EMJ7_ARUDO